MVHWRRLTAIGIVLMTWIFDFVFPVERIEALQFALVNDHGRTRINDITFLHKDGVITWWQGPLLRFQADSPGRSVQRSDPLGVGDLE
jgi:hypothetical protein